MKLRGYTLLFVGLALASISSVGCSSGANGRCAVGGRVTFQGAPLDNGTISFQSTGSTTPVTGGALIKNGLFDIPAVSGLEPGTYRVRISSPEESTTSADDYAAGKMPLSGRERIPAAHNTESKVTVEVKAGAANRFNFDL